jgi:hypothetical protein
MNYFTETGEFPTRARFQLEHLSNSQAQHLARCLARYTDAQLWELLQSVASNEPTHVERAAEDLFLRVCAAPALSAELHRRVEVRELEEGAPDQAGPRRA